MEKQNRDFSGGKHGFQFYYANIDEGCIPSQGVAMPICRYLLLLLITGLIPASRAEDLITFAVMGDVPYGPIEDKILPVQISDLRANLPFAVHVGDIKSGKSPCDLAVYEKVSGMLAKSKVPMFIIPGDNEWNDCTDPASAWVLWMKYFDHFEKHWTLPFPVKHDPAQSPNFAFSYKEVLFIGLNLVGGKIHDADEWKQRHADCLQWVKKQLAGPFAKAKAAVVFVHARPSPNHKDFFNPFSELAGEWKKPVLLLHGDGHRWMNDRPFPKAINVQRIQVDQGGIAPPLLVTVTGNSAEPFRFNRQLEKQPVIHRYPVKGLTGGPGKGALIIDGGSGGVDRVKNFQRFIELAGGRNARIVIVPTASEKADKLNINTFRKSMIKEGGIEPASMIKLHTNNPTEADTESFVAPIRRATGIWFGGGRQWRIVDAYGGTLSEREFRAVLERGGAIGGSSAGASIQGSFLARGDTKGNSEMLGDHQRGFAYLKNSAIDQHVMARGRELDMIKILTDPQGKMKKGHNRKSLLGLGIDEGTAAVVKQDQLEVIGKPSGTVLIYDPSTWSPSLPDKLKFIRLGPGSIYDLKNRITIKLVPPTRLPKKG